MNFIKYLTVHYYIKMLSYCDRRPTLNHTSMHKPAIIHFCTISKYAIVLDNLRSIKCWNCRYFLDYLFHMSEMQWNDLWKPRKNIKSIVTMWQLHQASPWIRHWSDQHHWSVLINRDVKWSVTVICWWLSSYYFC